MRVHETYFVLAVNLFRVIIIGDWSVMMTATCCSSSRFEGSLNVDLNEITMNLVPFPRLHYLVSSQSPLYALAEIKQLPRKYVASFIVL
jgi:hypothetical protein